MGGRMELLVLDAHWRNTPQRASVETSSKAFCQLAPPVYYRMRQRYVLSREATDCFKWPSPSCNRRSRGLDSDDSSV
ncbi:hypothetical protein J6590_048432 [Homalodisca vitripennis]|nr:hypothetical protein J6590_048432 [Homalodisca vitripennis]